MDYIVCHYSHISGGCPPTSQSVELVRGREHTL
jgi:hypothetical protein